MVEFLNSWSVSNKPSFFNSSAKGVWKKIVSKYFSKTNRKTIRKIDMPGLFNRLMDEAFTKRQCVSGFARCGLWPFDCEVMKDKVANKCDRSSLSASLSTKYSLKYVKVNLVD